MKLHTLQYHTGKGWSDSFPLIDSPQTLILAFAAPEFYKNLQPLQELAQHYPQAKILGCSSAGEINGGQIFDHSISVAIAQFEQTSLKIVKKAISQAQDSFKTGEEIAHDLQGENLRSIFLLSEGLVINGSELVKGLNQAAGKGVVITGGLAGDGKDFKNTWVIHQNEILTHHVVAIGLYGENIQIGHASRGGWNVFGPERIVTRSVNNVLFELDDQPALALYKEYLGDKASGLPATGLLYPLAIRKDQRDPHPLVRTILAVDEKTQSLTFAGDIPQGYLAQLMRSNFDRLITSASEAGTVAFDMVRQNTSGNEPLLAVAISCVGRRLLLGERTEEETESLLEFLPAQTKQVGFYSYGELSPYASGNCDLHNQTMTVTTFYERR